MLTIHTRLASPGVILYALGPNWNRVSALAAMGFVAGFVATYFALASGGSGAAAADGQKIIQIKELIEEAGGLKEAA
jgi:hypothetical protein